tara:strand:+ start:4927 stop:5370 length:444 start_codon:yes stop_codon:yes gene_type:complete
MSELAYCEVYKPSHHGKLNTNIYDINYIYTSILYQLELSLDEFYDTKPDSERNMWETNGPWLGDNYQPDANNESIFYNPFIRNTFAIKLNELQIVKRVYYKDYIFCIIKTFWLKILQRKWKKYYHIMMTKRKNIKNLQLRSVYGKWN